MDDPDIHEKNRYKGRRLLLLAVLAGSLSWGLCPFTARAEILASGSDSTLHVVKALAAGFEGQTGKSICLEGGGSRAGVKAAIAGQVHLTFLSRALSEQEKEAGLVGFPSAFEENRREALAVGADDFLGQPFREAELSGKIEALLGVRYRYAEPASAEGASSGQSQFGRLPARFTGHLAASLVNELREATLGVDVERMLELIEGVANHDAQLGEELRRLVHQFEYKRVLQLQYLTRHGN